jgi:hypothetical protein
MNTGVIIGVLLLIVAVIALAYVATTPKIKPRVTPTEEEINRAVDAALKEEIENTLANVSEAEVEQILLS